MRGFSVSEASGRLVDQYPPANVIREAAGSLSPREWEGVVRLWLSEGIPFAFQSAPLVFEAMRGWLANRVGVHPKNVTIVGSGRIGYSLAPPPDYGRRFSEESDLDIAIISDKLFAELTMTFDEWRADFATGAVHPRNPLERLYWEDNARRLPGNIAGGFLDTRKLPYFERYPTAQRLGQITFELKSKLGATALAPRSQNLSIRVFRDWDAFVRQRVLSLIRALIEGR